tara:strand:+ start:1581 stop:2141 length:561 start_codon:yes stop_codon:yes gene_type:complete
MAISIVATVGSASANSYVTLTEAQAFIDGQVESDDVVAWGNSTDDQKNRALFSSTQRIDREKFLGARVADTQALEWPRSGVRKPDTYSNLYGLSFPNRLVADYYLDTEIPDRVKHAQIVLAVYLNNNKDGIGLSGLEDFASVNIGNINITPRFYGAVGIDRIPPIVDHYLMGIRIGGRANLSIKRS